MPRSVRCGFLFFHMRCKPTISNPIQICFDDRALSSKPYSTDEYLHMLYVYVTTTPLHALVLVQTLLFCYTVYLSHAVRTSPSAFAIGVTSLRFYSHACRNGIAGYINTDRPIVSSVCIVCVRRWGPGSVRALVCVCVCVSVWTRIVSRNSLLKCVAVRVA